MCVSVCVYMCVYTCTDGPDRAENDSRDDTIRDPRIAQWPRLGWVSRIPRSQGECLLSSESDFFIRALVSTMGPRFSSAGLYRARARSRVFFDGLQDCFRAPPLAVSSFRTEAPRSASLCVSPVFFVLHFSTPLPAGIATFALLFHYVLACLVYTCVRLFMWRDSAG